MLEKDIEKILVTEIKKSGGVAYKFVSPGNSGVPDRIVLLDGCQPIFVELKTAGGKTTPLQEKQIGRIRSLGQDVRVLYGLKDLLNFFKSLGMDEATGVVERKLQRGEK